MSQGDRHIRLVAVIGAGISGVCATAHLLKQGLDVKLFERSSIAGGVWHLDTRPAHDPSYPNEKPSLGDYVRSPSGQYSYETPPRTPERVQEDKVTQNTKVSARAWADIEISHAPPGPCYGGLKNNVSLPLMKTSLGDWPETLGDFVSQSHLEEYIQAIAESTRANDVAEYHTRVEEVVKVPTESKWRVRTTTLRKLKLLDEVSLKIVEQQRIFDAVVVASGHYNMPRIPDIPGLKVWKARFPDRVWHSKRYRTPAIFKGQRVLLIGAGVSSTDIAKESEGIAGAMYQSSRGGDLDLPTMMLPPGTTRIGGVQSFELDDATSYHETSEGHLPGRVRLNNGSYLCNIDQVVLCTGYITSYPFLSQYHADDTEMEEVDENTLVTREGSMLHNCHKDIFHIPDPTLAFVGAPYHIATFSLFDFQAQVVARVFAGRAQLPSKELMREEYRAKIAARGLGRDFHSLRGEGEEPAYVSDLVDWVNSSLDPSYVAAMAGHTDTYHAAYKIQRERLRALGRRLEKGGGETFNHVTVECLPPGDAEISIL